MRRITRAMYHRAVKNIKRNKDKIRMEEMAEAISKNNSRDLWSEVRKIKGRNNNSPVLIDGISNPDEIASMIGEKYENLYNRFPYDGNEMDVIIENINKKIV